MLIVCQNTAQSLAMAEFTSPLISVKYISKLTGRLPRYQSAV